MTDRPILITGSTGFIGSRLWHGLVSKGLQVRRLGRKEGTCDVVVKDWRDEAQLAAACEGCGTVFHCAGVADAHPGRDGKALLWAGNVDVTRFLAAAAGRAGVRKFVFLSSVKAMGAPAEECVDETWSLPPDTEYGRSKRAAEDAAMDAGTRFDMQVLNLRPALVFGRGAHGNLQRMIDAIYSGWFPPMPATSNRRSLVHVDDLVDAMVATLRPTCQASATYIVSYYRPYSSREIYDAICCTLGIPLPRIRVPAWLMIGAAKVGDLSGFLLRRQLPLNTEVVKTLFESACYSSARIERELGWRGWMSLEDGLREMYKS